MSETITTAHPRHLHTLTARWLRQLETSVATTVLDFHEFEGSMMDEQLAKLRWELTHLEAAWICWQMAESGNEASAAAAEDAASPTPLPENAGPPPEPLSSDQSSWQHLPGIPAQLQCASIGCEYPWDPMWPGTPPPAPHATACGTAAPGIPSHVGTMPPPHPRMPEPPSIQAPAPPAADPPPSVSTPAPPPGRAGLEETLSLSGSVTLVVQNECASCRLLRPRPPISITPPPAPPKITVTIIRRVSDGAELTDFVKVRDGERWQAADGVEHVEKHGHRLLAAKAVSKVLIPSEPDGARAIKLPLADETGAVEAIRHDGEIIRIICKEGHA